VAAVAVEEHLPAWLRFLRPGFPSANLVLATEGARALVDSGYGSDVERVLAGMAGAGVAPGELELVVNTHSHSDHVGGNARLQGVHGVPVAASAADAAEVNARRPEACLAEWLDQPVEPYRVDRALEAGDGVAIGPVDWEVLATPGHMPSHLSLWQPELGVLVLGDALHADDVGWLNLPLDGTAAIERSLATVAELARLPVRVALSGHGPPVLDPPAAFAAARSRYERMLADPPKAAWHAMKRILAFALMIHDGIPARETITYVLGRPWLRDHAAFLGVTPEALAEELLAELRRAEAVEIDAEGRLRSRAPHHRPPPGGRTAPGHPRDWPAG
jgi:glyoxylase-like metal-dependent hydrolase (beta-lactamase superfamily II)